MARSPFKYWKFLVHVFCIVITIHNINDRQNVTKVIKFDRFLLDIKHILIWTNLHEVTDEGQTHFIKKKCSQINCYFTKNKTLFGDLRYFDAVVFNVSDLEKSEDAEIPDVRGRNQVYIFASNDSADKYPVCNPVYDGFFNWTWTYRQDSTIRYRFMSIYNNRAEELGSHFHWLPHMDPIDARFKSILATKYKAAAVFHDKCESSSNREGFILELKNAMRTYNMTLDIFGDCGTKQCKRRTFGACNWRLKKQYYFFLALEDSMDRDYVTGTVVRAYKNNVVPVVYGGADYSQFLPPNSYIDGQKLSIRGIAKKMYESIKHKEKYHDLFRWRNHYEVRESPPLDACGLCSKLAELPQMMGRSSYGKFREWWWPGYAERCWIASLNRE